ncbi:hypothetical protein IPJ72_04920 [Candidatus Peregrinibacteria bacterium]|nr:MAG: hypothetical protein IPJ72_04920 [Candidatus Peregrinibacteria bacterium]
MHTIKKLGLAVFAVMLVVFSPVFSRDVWADQSTSGSLAASTWSFQPGDWIQVELSTNTLRFHRWDSSQISIPFQVGSGLDQDENIYYAGAYYNPRTPAAQWMIKENNRQNSFAVFGTLETDENGAPIDEQPFLRLYRAYENGQYVRTKYGVHTTPYFERIVEKRNGYGSFGCILTDYSLLKFIESMYEFQVANGAEGLRVVTTRTQP